MILLDTDVCIIILRGNRQVIEQRKNCDERVAIFFMTVGELYYGAERSKYKTKNANLIEEFLLSIEIINTEIDILQRFGRLKENLNDREITLPDADILIASVALSKCSKLITVNINHFNRFENLTIENWIRLSVYISTIKPSGQYKIHNHNSLYIFGTGRFQFFHF